MKYQLESKLKGHAGIRTCSANPLTGSVLIHHDRNLSSEALAPIIESIFTSRDEAGIGQKRLPKTTEWSAQDSSPWHLMDAQEILERLGSSKTKGLLKRLAAERIRQQGKNILTEVARRSNLSILTAQFKTLPVALLSGSAALSLVTGGAAEAAVIFAVVVANAYIGYGTEKLAELTISLLSKMGPTHVVVIRDGKPETILSEDLVPGEVIVLVPGMYVPADARLLHAKDFTVDESALTGESMAVLKSAARLKRKNVPLAERKNMVYRGTVVTGGNGLAVVVATGQKSEIGKIQNLVTQTKPSETPLQKQMEKLSRQLVSMSGVMAGGVFVVGLLRGYGALEILKTSVTLAIAAVPEGLPTVATTTLADSALKMKRKNVLVRNLHAVETLGATQVICLDKTGTLTMNHMSAVSVFSGMKRFDVHRHKLVRNQAPVNVPRILELKRLFEVSCLCNETDLQFDENGKPVLKGSPTETALIEMGLQERFDLTSLRSKFPIVSIEHRTEQKSYMVTKHKSAEDETLLAVKGNPAEVLSLCSQYLVDGKMRFLTKGTRAAILKENEEMGGNSLRVLGFAFAETAPQLSHSGPSEGDPVTKKKLTWLGLVGIADKPREGIKELIQLFHSAGIQTTMITGDQSSTAQAIAEELGLSGNKPLHVFDWGRHEEVEPEALEPLLQKAHVFARVSPADKLQIVQSLRDGGKVVAMVGDGINDAPALKAADIGVAMGERGTEVAREVADAVLMDDDLHSLVRAIELGRTTFDAIKKSVTYLLGTNISESLIVFGSVAAGLGQPLNPLQLLWINLASDVFPALALGMEPPESDVLSRPPRDPNEPIISKNDFKRILCDASVMTTAALGTYCLGLSRYGQGSRAQTMVFMNLSASQLLHTLSSRSEKWTIFDGKKLEPNRYVPMSMAAGAALQFVSIGIPPVRRMLGVSPLSLSDLAICAGGAAISFVTNEVIRFNRRQANEAALLKPAKEIEPRIAFTHKASSTRQMRLVPSYV